VAYDCFPSEIIKESLFSRFKFCYKALTATKRAWASGYLGFRQLPVAGNETHEESLLFSLTFSKEGQNYYCFSMTYKSAFENRPLFPWLI
jgi:hypothetical protein